MTLQEKLKSLTSTEPSGWKRSAEERMATFGWRQNSGAVALRVLSVLRERGMNQSALAELLGVSRQQVSKIVKGNENLTFETIDKLERTLSIKLMQILRGDEPAVGKPAVSGKPLPVLNSPAVPFPAEKQPKRRNKKS